MDIQSNASRFRGAFAAFVVVVVALVMGGGATGCGNGEDDIGSGDSGRIGVRPQAVQFARVSLGETETKTLTVSNSGDGTLRVYRLEFSPKDGSTIEDLTIRDRPSGEFDIAPGEQRTFDIEFNPEEAGRSNVGEIRLFNSDPNFGSSEENPLVVDVGALGNSPRMDVSPGTVRFPRLPAGERMTQTVTVQNIGDAPLEIYGKPKLSGTSDFRVKDIDKTFPLELPAVGDSESPEERDRRRFTFEVQYAPSQDGSDEGTLLIESNETPGATPEEPSIKEIEVNANADSPCLLVDSAARNLGAVPLGGEITEPITVESCGSEPLEISDIEIGNNSNKNEFSLNLENRDVNDDGKLDESVFLEGGERANFLVTYSPEDAGTDEARVLIHSNDPAQRQAQVDLVARGAEGQCPTTEVLASVKGSSGVWRPSITAAPLDTVTLDGTGSDDPDGRIVEYGWRVIEKPDDSTVRLKPSEGDESSDAKREFRLLTAGHYKIGLTVEDNDGFKSCEEAVAEITAIPNEKVHVELTWTNPEDPDETDDNGSDVDVHMTKMGPGKWFEAPYDIYFRHPNNESDGGSGVWNPENPSLDIDDTDGRGPENIQMDDPDNCQWYAVGVHYYRQKYGTAYATIRIYINENLVFEKLNQPLQTGGEFWDVARIHWPTGRVYDVGEMYDVPPVEQEPSVTESMQSSDLCTAQDLY